MIPRLRMGSRALMMRRWAACTRAWWPWWSRLRAQQRRPGRGRRLGHRALCAAPLARQQRGARRTPRPWARRQPSRP